MKPMRFFLDTHDRTQKTFPQNLSPEDFEKFYVLYEQACYEENVVPVRIHVSYDEGRAYCLNMAQNVEAVRRAHERIGLPYDSIAEVATATPGDTFFRRKAA